MRARIVAALSLLLLTVPADAQNKGGRKYQIDEASKRVRGPYQRDGKLVYDVSFQIKMTGAESIKEEVRDVVVITENGREAHRRPLRQVQARELTAVLAMDISGSMARQSATGKTKMEEARDAARLFLDRLHPKADLGLILFDHAMKVTTPPAGDPSRIAAHRRELARAIAAAVPDGGTAYLDAAYEALEMLRRVEGNRAVVLMTDGVDLNSRQPFHEVAKRARTWGIPIYTLGIGDPGWNQPVNTVLVLDHSGSMKAPAGLEGKTRIEALHESASRFVDLMPATAKATLLPFSSRAEKPAPFSNDTASLKRRIQSLVAKGGTRLYDATLDGVRTVAAAGLPGKNYVVVLTDGVDEDPGSRHDVDEVIDEAKRYGVPLYMLGLGRKDEINEKVMRRMAKETGGEYFHAEDREQLLKVFEKLSVALHGDAIDEATLRALAKETGGEYYPARDASELSLIYVELARDLESTYTVTFPSLNQKNDGTVSAVDIYVVDKEGKVISNVAATDVARSGLVVPEVDYRVYLALLTVLLGLLYLPSGMRRFSKSSSI